MRNRYRAFVGVLLVAAVALVGCAQTGIDASRHTIYEGLDGIVSDSALIAVIEVMDQEVITDDIDYTISKSQVVETYTPTLLGASLTEDARVLIEGTSAPLEEITVRQLGTSRMMETPAPILEQGKRYLLFLTPTMIPGETAQNFYVTGGDAGIYEASDNGFEFTHDDFEAGDKLPTVIDEATLLDR